MFKLRERTAESDVSRKVVPDKRSLNRERPLTKALNPFTAAACKIYGPKDARSHLQTVYFPVL